MREKDDNDWLSGAYEKLTEKMGVQCRRTGSAIPFFPQNGRYADCMMPSGLFWWTNGFWPGILWQMCHATGDDGYKAAAQGVEERLKEILKDSDQLNHDVGFLFLPSAVANYRLTGNPEARSRGIQAANILLGRFNCKGGFIRAWNQHPDSDDVTGWMIVDCMLNIPLLFWASGETGDPRYANAAVCHAETALSHLLRADGSCNHIAVFDPLTGEFLGNPGGQGYGEGSSWSRGQGWAVYGFAVAYRHTGKTEFLDAAKRSANYCIANLTACDWLPLVDFRAPHDPVRYDSGAGAIIACGLLELAELLPKETEMEKRVYYKAAMRTLQACDKAFANWNPEEDGILTGGTMSYHDERLNGHAYIYNDYYFMEGILRLKRKAFKIW